VACFFCQPIFREALRGKSGKILVARSIRWRQPQPNEPARCAVRYMSLSGARTRAYRKGSTHWKMRPISEDAFDGPFVARNVAIVYATANELDAAFGQLNRLIQLPADPLSYGDLKTGPCWDPLRKAPRFDKLLAVLAPRD
jgi:hypothetical protein